ncbi:MAG: DUF2752 domain-containing protein [Bacteroidetes bacterium]|nr:MAG: DUF2752 domain-containing protein [Bacteroidota bacterium]
MKKTWLSFNRFYTKTLTRNKLYLLLSIACLAGYVWIFFNYSDATHLTNEGAGICLIKNVTNIPCPSCGSTRSVISILQGNILASLYYNPLGIILIAFLGISPFWIMLDIFSKRSSLFRFYKNFEIQLTRFRLAAPAILFIIAIWAWNIYKNI